MSKPNLTLVKNLELDEVTEEFLKLKNSLPEGTQISMFDFIAQEDETWFSEKIKELEDDSR